MDIISQIPIDSSQVSNIVATLQTQLTALALKLGGAILLWIVASWLIRKSIGLLSRILKKQDIDATLIRYLVNFLGVVLNIILIVAILGYFGIETTSFAALLAAAGIAIGAAWSGLLANFAAGVFLIIFRPFAVGDFIEAGGVTGTVAEIGLFVTAIDTLDNVRTLVGNNTIFAGTIQNFSSNPYRRVDLVAQLNHSVAPDQAIALLKESVGKIDNVLQDPAPDVEVLEFNLAGPVLAVRPYCNNDHYWQVYFDTNKAIRETFGEAGFPTPENHYALRQVA
ncbi:MscS Mechanosensitive ion channel [[Leptolyngbya] sp. PCC 7376]|uniref:mechanosensitive ion channel family protein n=1 Tax=[Leptolyngbya] sp. PCC 7376 TaxID=111781 RepID=UPI00029F3128|nr:mechanosensitive ion channel family protein [[Leptolyngbya] sp. PCC 7376]AFY38279.1 MscS Mechanosensitive ion channel [[Leptolyngbya] sp. PCC 7376]